MLCVDCWLFQKANWSIWSEDIRSISDEQKDIFLFSYTDIASIQAKTIAAMSAAVSDTIL